MSLRRFLPSSRRCFDPKVGLVARRGTGRTMASRNSSSRRSMASARLRSWVRKRWAWITITPSLVMRWPASRTSRAAASSGSVIWRVSKRSWAAVASLLTFCPPGPEARTKPMSMLFSSIVRSRETRSMAFTREGQSGIDARKIAVLRPALKDDAFPGVRRCAVPGTQVGGSVRLQRWRRRRGGRLRGGLRGAADDHGEQALAPQTLRGLFGVVERHGIDDGIALLDVVDWQ